MNRDAKCFLFSFSLLYCFFAFRSFIQESWSLHFVRSHSLVLFHQIVLSNYVYSNWARNTSHQLNETSLEKVEPQKVTRNIVDNDYSEVMAYCFIFCGKNREMKVPQNLLEKLTYKYCLYWILPSIPFDYFSCENSSSHFYVDFSWKWVRKRGSDYGTMPELYKG